MKKVLFVFFIMLSLAATAQVAEPAMLWLKGIGGSGITEVGKPVTKTNDNGFIIGIGTTAVSGSGNIDSFCSVSGNRDIYLKYSSDASTLEWAKCYQLAGDTSFGYIFPTIDGGFVLGGEYNVSGTGFYICKEDALGNIVWSHGYSEGNSLGLRCMIPTNDGGYIMGGYSNYTDTNVYIHYGSWMDDDIFLIKVDSLGNKVWTKVIGGTDEDLLYAIVSAPNGGCYVGGFTASDDHDCIGNHGGGDLYLARLDAIGNIMWHRDLGGTGFDNATCMVPNSEGGVILGGVTYSSDGDVTHHVDTLQNIWVVNVDSNGNKIWDSCYGGGVTCYANAVCKATDGSIWIAGVSGSKNAEVDTNYGGDDAWFVHIDSVGNLLNAKVLGSKYNDGGMMIYPLSNGNIIAGGFYEDSSGSFASVNTYVTDPGAMAFLTIFSPWNTAVTNINIPNNEIKLYPNPANEKTTVTSGTNDNCTLVIEDVLGRVVYKTAFVDKAEVQVKNWQNGMYYVIVISGTGYRNVQKLIVE